MTIEDQFSLEIARKVLKTTDEEVQLEVLNQMAKGKDGNLDDQIKEAKAVSKQAGDFGMEIIGPMIIPVLIEAGKSLWKLFVKKLGEKAMDKGADYTFDKIKELIKNIWNGKDSHVTVNDYENELKKAALAEGLSSEQTDRLIKAVRSIDGKSFD